MKSLELWMLNHFTAVINTAALAYKAKELEAALSPLDKEVSSACIHRNKD